MAKLYDLSDEERRELSRFLDNTSESDRRGMRKRRMREGDRGDYSVVGAIWDLTNEGADYQVFDTARAYRAVIKRIDTKS